ncbi:MAG: hypothetical protein LAO79_22290 [Acidobacteriia bacterium]|nr:hypothetical protein [Terriglobia bacterium]
MTSNLITTVIAALLALLLVGTISAFLLAVPAMSVVSVFVILAGMLSMFALGMHAGGRRIRIRRRDRAGHADLVS